MVNYQNNSILEYLYATEWKSSQLISTVKPNAALQMIIIFETDASKIADTLKKYYSSYSPISIELNKYAPDKDLEPYKALFEAINSRTVIYFIAGGFNKNELSCFNYEDHQSIYMMYDLIKILNLHRKPDLIDLRIITSNIHSLTIEETINTFDSGLSGMVKSIAVEYPKCKLQLVDIDYHEILTQPSNVVEMIEKSCSNMLETEKILRKGIVYTKHLKILPRETFTCTETTKWKKGGTYFIVGGASGLGYALSCYLAEQYKANLIWIGRREINEDINSKMANIASLGGQILYCKADCTSLKQMQEAITLAKIRFKFINGGVFSAVALQDKTLFFMKKQDFMTTYENKVLGCKILYKILQNEPLDFLLFYSSIVSLIGNHGQSNYAAGCSFNDTFALSLSKKVAYAVKVVNWSWWGNVGVVSSDEYKQRMTKLGMESIKEEEGMQIIEKFLNSKLTQLIVLKIPKKFFTCLNKNAGHLIENTYEVHE